MQLPSVSSPTFETNQARMPSVPQSGYDDQFNTSEWYSHFESCSEHFLEYGQYTQCVQAVTAAVNIKLPFQWVPDHGHQPFTYTILIPYIRRLVATGFDSPEILHTFFGDTWKAGIGPLHDSERCNYLFAAKSCSWLEVKRYYDMGDGQVIPFLRPLENVSETEIANAEIAWGRWLAMQDWMVGPRSPVELETEYARYSEN